nr:hypothetical protein [uncultured Rhodoferax sp.]
MKALVLACWSSALLAGPVCGQEVIALNRLPAGAAPSLGQSERSASGLTLQNTLVAFDTRLGGGHKRLGLSLTSFKSSPVELVYDPTAKSLMAQWRSLHRTAAGQAFQYQAYVGETGEVNFVLSSRF